MKNAMTVFRGAAVLSAVTACVATHARAAVLTVESFTGYANSNVDVVGNNGGSGWGGPWQSPQSDGFLRTVRTGGVISYSGYTGSTTPAASGGNYLNLASAFGGANPNNVFRPLDVSVGGVYGTNGYLASGSIGADNKTLWMSVLYSDERVKSGNQSFATLLFDGGFSTNLSQTATTNLAVLKLDFKPGATDTVTVWTNPNLATFDGTTGGVTSAPGNYAFTALRLRQTFQNGPGGSGAETQFDDIRFGTTVSDVVPAAVPEPTSIAALGLLSATMLRRRK